MKRLRPNYHALYVLKAATPKLRKAIISNSDRELVNSICECVLNVLNGPPVIYAAVGDEASTIELPRPTRAKRRRA